MPGRAGPGTHRQRGHKRGRTAAAAASDSPPAEPGTPPVSGSCRHTPHPAGGTARRVSSAPKVWIIQRGESPQLWGCCVGRFFLPVTKLFLRIQLKPEQPHTAAPLNACVLLSLQNPFAGSRCKDGGFGQGQAPLARDPPGPLPGRPPRQHRLPPALRLLPAHRGALHLPVPRSRPTAHPGEGGAHQPGVRPTSGF